MEGLYKLISDRYAEAIEKRLSQDKLCEVRISDKKPVRVCYDGVYRFLCAAGITRERTDAFVAAEGEAEEVVMRACGRSLYTVTETLKAGYVAADGGIRIGVCGSAVTSNGVITAVKRFTSVNIRVPHEINGCAAPLLYKILDGGRVRSTLIISPPGVGKTTVIRDLCRLISDRGYNVLVCDEKYEISSGGMDTGSADVFCGADKQHVFDMGIAYMRPDVIVADELFGSDVAAVIRAAYCGVAVIATAHARDIAELKEKPDYAELIRRGVFSRYAVLLPPPNRDTKVYAHDGARFIEL